MFSLDKVLKFEKATEEDIVISRYLGMFSLDYTRAIASINVEVCYFPLSWDVLIRLWTLKLLDLKSSVISRYLGMFSLDNRGKTFKEAIPSYFPLSWDVLIRLDSHIFFAFSSYGYFPLSWDVLIRSCPPEPLFLASFRGDLRGKPLQGIFSRFYFSKNAHKRPFYVVRGKRKNHLSEL